VSTPLFHITINRGIFYQKTKKIKKFYLYFILWISTLLIYFNFLINSQNIETTTFFFYFCAIFHIYPLYIGISLVYTASQKREKNLEEVQQKKLQQKKLQQRKTQVKEEQQKKLQQKKAQVKEEQRKEIQQKKLEIAQLQQKKLQVEEEQRKKLQQKEKELQELQRKDIQQTPPPTDQEFDAWLENRVREGLASTIHKLGLEDMIANPRELLRVRGYILPGMRDARDYRPQDLLYKLGADGKRRYSINLYTYFYPANNRIMVFTYEINAMNWNDYRETTREYFYQDVIGATTEDNHDKLYIDGKPQSYRTQRFSLRLCDGTAISATVRSRPLDVASLPVFDIDPESDIDKTIAYLRLVLREKKA